MPPTNPGYRLFRNLLIDTGGPAYRSWVRLRLKAAGGVVFNETIDADGICGEIEIDGSGAGPSPGASVVTEQAFGQASAVGVSPDYSRKDHSHGTPAAPTAASVGAIPTTALDTDGTLAANSDVKVPSQKAVKTYVDTVVTGLLDMKGGTDCSANPDYPAASKGDAYYVTVAGKIGGAAGVSVEVGDVYFANADNAGGTQAGVGTSWNVLEHNLIGALLAANNLSDVPSPSTARTNLGLAIGSDVQAFDAKLAPFRLLGRCDPIDTIIASSASGHVERDPHTPTLIRLKLQTWADAADAIASVPTGWTFSNTGGLTSAAIASGELTMVHNGSTADAYGSGTNSAPNLNRTFSLPTGRWEWIYRQRVTAGTAVDDVAKAVIGYAAGRQTLGSFIICTAGPLYTFRVLANDATASSIFTGQTTVQAATGWWVRFVVDPISGAYRMWHAKQASQPTTAAEWTFGVSGTVTQLQAATWTLAYAAARTSGTGVTGCHTPVVERIYQDTAYQTPYVPFGTGGYAATSDAIVFAASINCGVPRLPDETLMRLFCADAANRLPGDAASWTWSITGSNSANPAAATTYQAAAALTIKQAGSDTAASAPGYTYWAIRAKAASTSSAQAGSIDTSSLWLVAA